jgi:hypothetical protein
MFHRSYGETKDCKGCRYWSEMIAKSEGAGVAAMCINIKSDRSGKYTLGLEVCDEFKTGQYGAIDSPGEAEEIIAAYEQDDL